MINDENGGDGAEIRDLGSGAAAAELKSEAALVQQMVEGLVRTAHPQGMTPQIKRKLPTDPAASGYQTYRVGGIKKLKASIQHHAQQGVASINMRMENNLFSVRKSQAEQNAHIPGMATPLPGTGAKSDYDLLPGELVFSVSPQINVGSGLAAHRHRSLESSATVFSAFNDVPNGQKLTCRGVATKEVNQSNAKALSATGNVAVCPQGTFTIPVSHPVEFGQRLMWTEPDAVLNPGDLVPVNGLRRDGVSPGKYFAGVAPLDFTDTGSIQMYRQVAKHLRGDFLPGEVPNPLMQQYDGIVNAMDAVFMLTMMGATAEKVDDAMRVICDTVFPPTVYAAKTLSTAAVNPAFEEYTAFAPGYVADNRARLLANLGIAPGDAIASDSREFVQASLASDAALAWLSLRAARARSDHYKHFLDRHIGTALQTGAQQDLHVFVKTGRAF